MKITEKKRILLDIIFSIIILVVSITLMLLLIFIEKKEPKTLPTFILNDILIDSLKSFTFIEDNTIPVYPNKNILGITGELILDCYAGTCTYQEEHFSENERCDEDGDNCYTAEYSWTETETKIDLNCSIQCYNTGNSECKCSGTNAINKGICNRNKNDEYKEGKFCDCYNAIYFWKGKKYKFTNSNYTYLEDAVLKDEVCPKWKKNCGTIDNSGNQLCVDEYDKCPINYISDKQSSNDYDSVLIDNKTYYYGYDNTSKKQIIEGLAVDTDLIPNNNTKDILDENTLSGLLEDNKNLFQGINLGYDPYKINNIDSKGKSYLRISYNERNVDLSQLRKDRDKSYLTLEIKTSIINSIEKKTKSMVLIGLISLAYLIIVILIFICNQACCYKKGTFGKNKKVCYFILILLFFGLIVTPLVFGCINVGKAKDGQNLNPNDEEYSIFKNLNLSFIIIGFALVFLLIACVIIVLCKLCYEEEVNEKVNNTINETNSNAIVRDFK